MKMQFLMIGPSRCPACGSKDERYRRGTATGGDWTCDHDWHYPNGRPKPQPSRIEPLGPQAQFTDTSFEATQARIKKLREA